MIHIPPGCVSNRRDSPTACKTVHRTVLHPRCARAGLSSPISRAKKEPQRAPFWCEYSFWTFCKSAAFQRFWALYRFQFDPHPFGMRLKSERLSHGLQNSPPDCFAPSLRSGRPFESPLSRKKGAPKGSFLVRERGLEPPRRNHTHLKRACLPFQHSRSCLNIITGQGVFVNPFFSKSLVNAWLPVHSSPFLCHMRHNSKAPISAPKPQRRSHRSGSR